MSKVVIYLLDGFRYRVVLCVTEAWDGLAHSLSSLYLFQERLQSSTTLTCQIYILCDFLLFECTNCFVNMASFPLVFNLDIQKYFVPFRWRKNCLCEGVGRTFD